MLSKMTPASSGRLSRPHVLIVSQELSTVEQIKNLMRPFKFHVAVCTDPRNFARFSEKKKLDAVMLSWNPDLSKETVSQVRKSSSNRTAIVCAIVNDSEQGRSAFQNGCNFVIDQPASAGSLQRFLQVMNGLIVKEYRHYARCQGNVSVRMISPREDDGIECLNLSEGGIGLQLRSELGNEQNVKLAIDIHDNRPTIQIEARVRWSDKDNRAGLKFTHVPVKDLIRLQSWTDRQISTVEMHTPMLSAV